MTTAAASQGAFDLRRLYTRFLLLVGLPVIVLVGFGVLAIHNERAAVESRFRQEYTQRLHVLAQNVITALETEANRLVRNSKTPAGELVRFEFSFRAGQLVPSRTIDGHLADALTAGLMAAKPPDNGSVALLPIPTGAASGLYAFRLRRDGTLIGLSFSQTAIASLVQHDAAFLYPGDSSKYTVEGPPDTPVAAINPLMTILDQIVHADIESGIVSLPLPGALGDWRIVAQLPSDDPVRMALWRNRALYIVILIMCAGAIAFGVFVTLRGIWQEARLSRLKTDFVSNISHEMRTPLASIRMFADTLRQGRARTPEEQQACLDIIARESERLSLMANRTLDWARIEAGQQPYAMKRIPAGELLQQIVNDFLARGSLPREALSIRIDDALPDLNVDPMAIGQVMINLLENAVKYTGPEKRIAVRGQRQGKSVRFDVEDNGIGISEKDRKRVFERFFRANDHLARQTEGTGLGLSIAQRIVEAHHGRLTVESVLGKGSVFTVLLPAVSSPRAGSTAASTKESLA